MDINKIKDIRDAMPFRRFSIELNSGRLVEVPSSDHLFISTGQKYVIVENGHLFIIDLESISALVMETPKNTNGQ